MLTQGFETVWIIWAAATALTAAITIYGAGRLKRATLRSVLIEEDGAAYTLSYVLVTPFYALLVCVVAETTLMLVAKTGTVYAAFGAARSAIVWDSATTPARADRRARQTAIRAMMPYASGLAKADGAPAALNSLQREYLAAYRDYAKDIGFSPASEKYLESKFRYATQALRVSIERRPGSSSEKWDEDIAVTVRYEYPCSIPGVGRMFGRKASSGRYVFDIESRAVLQNEAPQNDPQRTGIRYASP